LEEQITEEMAEAMELMAEAMEEDTEAVTAEATQEVLEDKEVITTTEEMLLPINKHLQPPGTNNPMEDMELMRQLLMEIILVLGLQLQPTLLMQTMEDILDTLQQTLLHHLNQPVLLLPLPLNNLLNPLHLQNNPLLVP
jgi:hypothetical protein